MTPARFIPTCVGNIRCVPIFHRSPVGSSPRVWGTCARACSSSPRAPVHPHVCGEHVRPIAFLVGRDRFIPTCVGNMLAFFHPKMTQSVHPHVCGEHVCLPLTALMPSPVHPHVCGEHCWNIMQAAESIGSSPRVWGTCGIFQARCPLPPVHPHVCGEHERSPRLARQS